jgi:hypothetical protein
MNFLKKSDEEKILILCFFYLEAGWMFSLVFQIRKCFLNIRIRIRSSVILNCGHETGGQLITNLDLCKFFLHIFVAVGKNILST